MTTINLVKQIRERQASDLRAQESAQSAGVGNRFAGIFSASLEKEERVRLVLMVLGILCIVGSRFGVDAYVAQQENEARIEVGELDQQIAEENRNVGNFAGIKSEIESYETKMNELREKLTLIASASKNRNVVVHMIDFVVSEMPASLWLNRIVLDNSVAAAPGAGNGGTPGTVAVYGYATSLQLVSEFMKRLEGAVFFPRWELIETEDNPEVSTVPNVPNAAKVANKATDVPPDAKKFQITARIVAQ